MDSMFEQLLTLPLFRGVSITRISEIVGAKRFHFLQCTPGQKIITAGEPCTHIRMVISGSVTLTVSSKDGRLRVSQRLAAPDVLAPDFLFGRYTDYPCDVTAYEKTGILQITKSDYVDILHADRAFLFNYLNMLSRRAQMPLTGILAVTAGSLEQRIAFWIIALTQHNSTDIELEGRHRDLYAMFGVQRSVFIATLNEMQERGILEYTNRTIRILSRPMLEGLLN